MNIKHLFGALYLAIFAFTFTACSDDDEETVTPVSPKNIVEIVTANTDYSSLVAALQRAELVETLKMSGPYTVLAPNNDAFEAYLGDTKLEDVPVATLKQLLLNHVLSGKVMSEEISTKYYTNLAQYGESANYLSMYFKKEDDNSVMINGTAKVTSADISASNGVIHYVDKVIPLPTVVTFVTADANFSTLATALTRDDQANEGYVNALSTSLGTIPAPFTVFAPTNDAFTALLTELQVSELADISGAVLTSTLDMHVFPEMNKRAADLTNGSITSFGNEVVTIDKDAPSVTDSNNRVSKITVTDVQAANGVIHAIDKVILAPQQQPVK